VTDRGQKGGKKGFGRLRGPIRKRPEESRRIIRESEKVCYLQGTSVRETASVNGGSGGKPGEEAERAG